MREGAGEVRMVAVTDGGSDIGDREIGILESMLGGCDAKLEEVLGD
jgi:hypothetical protein